MQLQLVEGDAVAAMDSLEAGSVDLVVADPPYFRVVQERWDAEWHTPA